MNQMQTSKSVLAKLLSSENLTIEHGNYNTAAFDVKNRVLYLPVFKYMNGDVYDLMVLHEVGHALFTPENGFHSSSHDMGPGFKSYLNVCEDARIEKKIKRKYPGGVRPMTQGYRKLMQEDFFGTAYINVNKLNLIDRINLHTKGGASQLIEFSDVEKEFLTKVEQSETFEEVEEIAKILYEYSQQHESETDFHDESMYSEELDDLTESLSDDDIEQKESMNDFGNDSIDSDDTLDSGHKRTDDDDDQETQEQSEGGSGAGDRFNDNPSSFTDDKWQENSQKLNLDNTKPYLYVNIPVANLDNIIVNYKLLYKKIDDFYTSLNDKQNRPYYWDRFDISQNAKEYFYQRAKRSVSEFRKKNNKVVDYLVKEFEMRKKADEYKRTNVSKTGLLDMANVHAYKYSDNLFKRVAKISSGKNHGLVMFIDWSGSMSNNLAGTIEQLLNLIMFCRKVNIPFQVFAFSDLVLKKDMIGGVEDTDTSYESHYGIVDGLFSTKPKDYNQNYRMSLLELFSNKMSTSELNKAFEFLIMVRDNLAEASRYSFKHDMAPPIPPFMSLCGTPLNQAIIAALEVVPKFKVDNRVQVVNTVFLTDGDSHTRDSYYNEDGKHRGFSTFNENIFFVDPVTKKSYRVDNRREYTDILYTILKDRLDVNVMGFYLLSQRSFKHFALDIAVSEKLESDKIIKTFRDKKCFVAKKFKGYDELYYIKDGNDLMIDNDEFTVKEDATKSQLTTAFKKFNRDKIGSRIVMKSFAEQIA